MLKLTGGEFRGRSIQTPASSKTRPTQAKLRQALFNSIQMIVPDARVLDLFSGSGALGFEALSRGAASVTFVETSRPALAMIEKNAQTLGVSDRVRILSESAEHCFTKLKHFSLEDGGPPFDVVMADPPYEGGWEHRLIQNLPWEQLLNEGGLFLLEWGVQKSRIPEMPEQTPFLVKVREKNYGDSVLTTYRRENASSTSST